MITPPPPPPPPPPGGPLPPPPRNWVCGKRVGFLYPHPCDRVSPLGCTDCNNGLVYDPYRDRRDRGVYGTDYDADNIGWSTADAAAFVAAGGDSGGAGASMDFSEADGATLVNPGETFEDDSSAS